MKRIKGTKGIIWRGLTVIMVLALILGALPLTPTARAAVGGDSPPNAMQLFLDTPAGGSFASTPFWFKVDATSVTVNVTLTTTAGPGQGGFAVCTWAGQGQPSCGTGTRSATALTGQVFYFAVQGTAVGTAYSISASIAVGQGPMTGGSKTNPTVMDQTLPMSHSFANSQTANPSMWFSKPFNPAAGGLNVSITSPAAVAAINVYNPDGVTALPGQTAGQKSFTIPSSAPPGTYLFEVAGIQNAGFTIDWNAASTGSQPGTGSQLGTPNRWDNQPPLPIDQDVTGHLDAGGSRWFKLYFGGEALSVSLSSTSGSASLAVAFGQGPTAPQASPYAMPAISNRGDYFINVMAAAAGVDYALRASRTGSVSSDPGATQSAAIQLANGVLSQEYRFSGPDIWFSYDYTANTELTVEMQVGAQALNFEVFNDTNVWLSSGGPRNGPMAASVIYPSTGRLFFKVHPFMVGFVDPTKPVIFKMKATAGQAVGSGAKEGDRYNPKALTTGLKEVGTNLPPGQTFWYSYSIPAGKNVQIALGADSAMGVALNIHGPAGDAVPGGQGVRTWTKPSNFPPSVLINVAAPFGGSYSLTAMASDLKDEDGLTRETAITLLANQSVSRNLASPTMRLFFRYSHDGRTVTFKLKDPQGNPHTGANMDVFDSGSMPLGGGNFSFLGPGTPPGDIIIVVNGKTLPLDFTIAASTQDDFSATPQPGAGGPAGQFEMPATTLKATVFDCASQATFNPFGPPMPGQGGGKLVPKGRIAVLYNGQVLTTLTADTGTIDISPKDLPNQGTDGHYDLRGLPPKGSDITSDTQAGANCAPGFTVGVNIRNGFVEPRGDPNYGQHLDLQAAQLQGTVTDPTGAVVPNARVKAIPNFGGQGFGGPMPGGMGGPPPGMPVGAEDRDAIIVKTNGKGVYRMGGFMPVVSYKIVAYPPEPGDDGGPGVYGQSLSTDKSFMPSAMMGPGFGPSPTPTLDRADLKLTPPDISGVVTSSSGTPVAGAKVTAQEEGNSSGTIAAEGFSDTNGTYRLGGLTAGKTYLLAAKPASGSDKASAPKRQYFAGTAVAEVGLALSRAQLSVVVYNGKDASGNPIPVAGARVNANSMFSFGPQAAFIPEEKTDASGQASFGGLADGQYSVMVFPDSMKMAPAPPQQTSISKGSASPDTITFNLGSASLSGTVYQSDETTPATNISVEIFGADVKFRFGVGADPQGRFSAGGMPAGKYKIQAKVLGGVPGQSQDSDSSEYDVTILPDGTSDPTVFNGKLFLTKPQLVVTIQDPDGKSLGQALPFPLHVSEIGEGGMPVGSGAEAFAPNWQARLGGMKDGKHSIGVFVPPMLPFVAPSAKEITVTGGAVQNDQTNPQVISGTLTLKMVNPKKGVTGTVKKSDGTPAMNAGIHAFKEDGSGNAETDVNPDGTYSLRLAKGGVWLLSVFPRFDRGPGMPGSGDGGKGMQSKSISDVASELDWIFTEPPRRVELKDDDTLETAKDVDFKVGKAGALVTGKVEMDGTGQPPDVQVFVDVRDDAGVGNTVPLPPGDGKFRVAVPSGITARVRVFSNQASQKGEPPLVEPKDSAPVELKDAIKLTKSAHTLTGKVVISGATDATGQPIGVDGIEVAAFIEGGGGFATAKTSAGGVFTLGVSDGEWRVSSRPGKGSRYSSKGRPTEVKVAGQNVADVVLEVEDADGEITATLTWAAGASSPFSISQLFGFGIALDKSNNSLAGGTPMERGTFKLKVPSGKKYTVGVNFPPGLAFGATPEEADLTSSKSASVNIKVAVANADVRGVFQDKDKKQVSGIEADVMANGPLGFKSTSLRPSGTYALSLIAGTWYIGSKVKSSGYAIVPPADNKVEAVAGDEVAGPTFTVVEANGKVAGIVKSPGTAGAGTVARVWAETRSSTGEAPRVIADTVSGADGSYKLSVPAGTYVVRAAAPPEKRYLTPLPIQVEVPDKGSMTVDLQFRAADVSISGTVTGTGAEAALVTAYSDKGAWSSTNVSVTAGVATFSVDAAAGDVWHLVASSSVSSTVYRSLVLNVAVTRSITAQELKLEAVTAFSLPSGSSVSFDPNSMQVLALDDGTQVTIPSGALSTGTSGNVTVYVIPTEKLANQPSAQSKLIGYNLKAFDPNNVEIKKFKQSITLKVPYPSDDKLTELGITESKLKPMYYDTTSGSWVTSEPYSQDTVNNVFTISTDHFTIFAGILTSGAQEVGSGTVKIYLPAVLRELGTGW
ncbi:MAG: carboxypeptidase-like regulatory domain-containing protein [Dehalococcoidia bacterium]|nr:carboxypeptidase-like regulatory domain-containing protein [Dehalococcoidia bacterium]